MKPVFTVSVVNNLDCYRQCIADNPFCAECSNIMYDNCSENIPISVRYNHFIEHTMPEKAWVIFCHQDLEFLEDPLPLTARLDPNVIYGPIGVCARKYKTWRVQFGGPHWFSSHRSQEVRPVFLGQIKQGLPGKEKSIGRKIKTPQPVDTLDCCCLIVHSSLIKRFNLRFDPQFDFHLYCEDFCLSGRKHGIKTYICQTNCRHLSPGNVTEAFWLKYRQLLKKYPTEFFLTTCAGIDQYIYYSLDSHWEQFPEQMYDLYRLGK